MEINTKGGASFDGTAKANLVQAEADLTVLNNQLDAALLAPSTAEDEESTDQADLTKAKAANDALREEVNTLKANANVINGKRLKDTSGVPGDPGDVAFSNFTKGMTAVEFDFPFEGKLSQGDEDAVAVYIGGGKRYVLTVYLNDVFTSEDLFIHANTEPDMDLIEFINNPANWIQFGAGQEGAQHTLMFGFDALQQYDARQYAIGIFPGHTSTDHEWSRDYSIEISPKHKGVGLGW